MSDLIDELRKLMADYPELKVRFVEFRPGAFSTLECNRADEQAEEKSPACSQSTKPTAEEQAP